MITRMILRMLPVLDVVILPWLVLSAFLLKKVRRVGVWRLPWCKRALLRIGVFPITDHYYEPRFIYSPCLRALSDDRQLPGIDMNVREQLELLTDFTYGDELLQPGEPAYDFNNATFAGGDAEFLYHMIRLKKPRRIIEIGSGNSTVIAIKAVKRNAVDDAAYACDHRCIEPYEMPWLESTGLPIIRKKVEDVDLSLFSSLESDDLLFIDSSHMIRPQGDVLFEYLQLLPSLKPGVIVHVHDIFSPKDYPESWVIDQVRFWNEQYLLEAFLTHNTSWKIIGALNYLHHHHYAALRNVCPFLDPTREPESFYMQKLR